MMMKALTITNPWAWLVVYGFKPIENRDWQISYRGPLVIHAGRKCGQEQQDAYMHVQHQFPHIRMPKLRDMPGGGIVGLVELVDVVTVSDSPWFRGKFGHVFANPRPCQFMPMLGKQGLFPVPASSVIIQPSGDT